MCGRFTLRTANRELAELFHVHFDQPLPPRYNIAPTQQIAAVREKSDVNQRELVLLRWGLIPPWADDTKIGNRMINARAETIAEKRSFQKPLKTQRCLILADGFYEWQNQGGQKQPYLIQMQDSQPFAFAGLWERWNKESPAIESCTIITTAANELMSALHERMPVILAPNDYDTWLDPAIGDPARLLPLLVPCPSAALRAHPVSTAVNRPTHDHPDCIKGDGSLF